MLLGAHVSAAGGPRNAPANGVAIGCDAIQLFAKNQRQWTAKPYTQEEIDAYRDAYASSGLKASLVHTSYLINMGSPDAAMWKRSVAAFADEYTRSQQLGIDYLVFHPGAHVGSGEDQALTRIAKGVRQILEKNPDGKLRPLIEITAGQGSVVGYTFEQLADLRDRIDDPRVGICLDTQHTWAAGYDLKTAHGYAETFRSFDGTVGLKHLAAFHLNDSKPEQASRRDRHEDIGKGTLGMDAFRMLVNDPRFRSHPGILETPGGPPSWKRELKKLRSLEARSTKRR